MRTRPIKTRPDDDPTRHTTPGAGSTVNNRSDVERQFSGIRSQPKVTDKLAGEHIEGIISSPVLISVSTE
jgi:hypothetical protein